MSHCVSASVFVFLRYFVISILWNFFSLLLLSIQHLYSFLRVSSSSSSSTVRVYFKRFFVNCVCVYIFQTICAVASFIIRLNVYSFRYCHSRTHIHMYSPVIFATQIHISFSLGHATCYVECEIILILIVSFCLVLVIFVCRHFKCSWCALPCSFYIHTHVSHISLNFFPLSSFCRSFDVNLVQFFFFVDTIIYSISLIIYSSIYIIAAWFTFAKITKIQEWK